MHPLLSGSPLERIWIRLRQEESAHDRTAHARNGDHTRMRRRNSEPGPHRSARQSEARAWAWAASIGTSGRWAPVRPTRPRWASLALLVHVDGHGGLWRATGHPGDAEADIDLDGRRLGRGGRVGLFEGAEDL